MKLFSKILIGVVCWVAIVGFLVYEGYSIVKKEYVRQSEVAVEAHEKINTNLDMIKIGVLTEDVEMYEKNLAGVREQVAVISPLWLIESEQADYLTELKEYADYLEGKVTLLKEMREAKGKIVEIKEKMSENYGNKDSLTRDKLKEVKTKVAEFKIDESAFSEEKILAVVKSVNGVLDGVVDKSAALADCIDACYKNRINEINDELADKIKSFADAVAGLNLDLEKEFDFNKMEIIRNGKKEEQNEQEV